MNTASELILSGLAIPNPKYPIGTQFRKRGRKNQSVYTVKDYITSFNSTGDMVGQRYIASHVFCGQEVFDHNVPEATIALGLIGG